MVSTRASSQLSAGAQGDDVVTAGEVNSSAPTPRRSGRLRTSGGSAAATPAAPRSTRSVRTRRLTGIQEAADEDQQVNQEMEQLGERDRQEEAHQVEEAHPQQQQQQQQEPEQQQQAAAQQQEQQEEQLSPRARRRRPMAATAAAASPAAPASGRKAAASGGKAAASGNKKAAEPEAAAEVAAHGADAALVDVLAEQMFAALEGLIGEQQRGGSGSEDSSDEEPQEGGGAQPGSQQQQQQGEHEGEAGSSSEEDSEGEGGADDSVPAHLRWRPELSLPGQQLPQGRGGASAAAAAAAAGGAAGVHVVRRGKDGLHVPPPDMRAQMKAAKKERPDTAGKGWFDLPATQITDEVKNDLRMLRLRGALDPKAHYKKLDSTKFPKYFQMGTVVEGAADFYSGRLTNKQRKRTLTEEILADGHLSEVRKKRFTKLQEERTYWSKKKGPGKKSSGEHNKKPHHRPKH